MDQAGFFASLYSFVFFSYVSLQCICESVRFCKLMIWDHDIASWRWGVQHLWLRDFQLPLFTDSFASEEQTPWKHPAEIEAGKARWEIHTEWLDIGLSENIAPENMNNMRFIIMSCSFIFPYTCKLAHHSIETSGQVSWKPCAVPCVWVLWPLPVVWTPSVPVNNAVVCWSCNDVDFPWHHDIPVNIHLPWNQKMEERLSKFAASRHCPQARSISLRLSEMDGRAAGPLG